MAIKFLGPTLNEAIVTGSSPNWGELNYIDAATDVWRTVFGDVNGGVAKLYETQCNDGNSCTTNSANWSSPPTLVSSRPSAQTVRATNYAVASDGSEHVLRQDHRAEVEDVLVDDNGHVFYARRCPGGSWTGAVLGVIATTR